MKRKWNDLPIGEVAPAFQKTYTIRAINIDRGGYTMLQFEEVVNPLLHYREGICECQFWAKYFRPIVARKTDISIFTSMLNPSKVDA